VLCGVGDSIKCGPKLIIVTDFVVRSALVCENYRKKNKIKLLRRTPLGTDLQAVLAGSAVKDVAKGIGIALSVWKLREYERGNVRVQIRTMDAWPIECKSIIYQHFLVVGD